MRWYLRGETHPTLMRSPKRMPQTQDGSAGLGLGEGELGTMAQTARLLYVFVYYPERLRVETVALHIGAFVSSRST
jgi:hypothetical protein